MQQVRIAGDEAMICSVINRVQAGWNVNDGEAFAAPFADDADYVVVNGHYLQGRQAIAQGHQQIFDTVYKNSHNSATVQSVRFLRDDVAVAHVQWQLKFQQGDAVRESRAFNTLVLTKHDDAWRIAAFQNTPIAPRNGE